MKPLKRSIRTIKTSIFCIIIIVVVVIYVVRQRILDVDKWIVMYVSFW